MFWGLINTLLYSLSEVYQKKALELSNLPKLLFLNLGDMVGLTIGVGLVIIGEVNLGLIGNYWALFLIAIFWIGNVIYDAYAQKIFREEKISAILPYEQVSAILSIMFGFLIFKDGTITSFICAILAAIVITLFSIDFKKFTFPKNFKLIIGIQLLWAVMVILSAYILHHASEGDLFFFTFAISVVMVSMYLFFKGEYKRLDRLSLPFYRSRFVSSFTVNASLLLDFFLISELGLVNSILLGFIGIGTSLILAYIQFKDIPTKKDLILTAIIFSLVTIGMFF